MRSPYLLDGIVCGLVMCIGIATNSPASAQNKSRDTGRSIDSILAQIQELRGALDETRRQLASSTLETEALRREVQSLRERLAQVSGPDGLPRDLEAPLEAAAGTESGKDPGGDLALLAAKVDEQDQTKVESGSKHRVRLSGMVLLNAYTTRGAVDDLDLPFTALPVLPGETGGSTAATLRQSLVRLEVFGPRFLGASTAGELTFDFFGGFPVTPEGVTSGLVRLRTAKLNLEWADMSVVAGQDVPFFSPLSPTSLVSTAYPALSASGNLWTWTPQAYIERRFSLSDRSKLILQGGVLNALTGEQPVTEYVRSPASGERTRIPASALRLAWQGSIAGRTARIGAGAYYSRQDWTFNRTVDAWSVTSDFDLPLGPWFSLSGELYRGRAIAGLGGGATGSVVFVGNSTSPGTTLIPVESLGGWSQIKFKPVEKIEFNASFGKDGALGRRLARLPETIGMVHRNASGLVNVIYQPRTNLFFSAEYRRLWTSRYWQDLVIANHFGLGAGIAF